MTSNRDAFNALLSAGNFALFLGAGASVEAGIPTWGRALEELSKRLGDHSAAYAAVMREEVAKARFLEAAEFLYMADWSEQQRADALTAIFGAKPKVTARLRALARLPFHSVITTNFDRAFIEAAVQESISLLQFNESGEDLASARVCRERYILRMHGRIEVPSSLVLARRHFSALVEKPQYAGFVQSLVTDAPVVFFGFSFNDPYLVGTLEGIANATGGRMRHQGFALLSQTPTGALADLLQRLNVAPVVYSADNNHAEAWTLLSREKAAAAQPVEGFAEGRLRQTLAWMLTHLRVRNDADLQSAVIGAAVLAELSQIPQSSVDDALEEVRQRLGLPPQHASLVRDAVANLTRQGRVRVDGGRLTVPLTLETIDSSELGRLSDGIKARARTRYNVTLSPTYSYDRPLQELLLRILVADGMLLAHSFVGQRNRTIGQIQQLTLDAIAAMPTTDRKRLQPIAPALVSVLDRPEPDEEELLDQLASMTFLLCTTLASPSVVSVAQDMRRKVVYLDASVLLPWLCVGHPTEGVSKSIIENIGQATVPDFYLNEIVAHRNLATREVQEAGLRDASRFQRYVKLYGLQNINAYLGGWGGSIARGFAGTFQEYLVQFAPYSTEIEAGQFLKKKGLEVVSPRVDTAHTSFFRAGIRDRLEKTGRRRDQTRIDHDSTMLAALLAGPSSSRPYFVTADKILLSTVAEGGAYREILARILLPYQAASLAQMVKGGTHAIRGLSRTIFGVRRGDIENLREFYIDRVLEHYEPALISEIPTIVDAIVSEAETLTRQLGDYASADDDATERVRRFTALDQFEPLFHQKMSEAQRRTEQ